MTDTHEKYITRCLELARLANGVVSPNPMVGSVIVHDNQIIGEGYHQKYGGSHAEVHAIQSVANPSLLKDSTIYVSLEPCSHYGKTPPCADLIIKHQIPRVVISTLDTHQVVCGNGVAKLKEAGIDVIIGVSEGDSKKLNKAFNTFQETKKPWVILKWAQTADGFIDHHRTSEHPSALKISNASSSLFVHKLRAEVDAILVGKNTVIKDNPSLTTRKWAGKNPVRVIIDSKLEISSEYKIYDNSVLTLIFNTIKQEKKINTELVKLDAKSFNLDHILIELGKRNIQSLLVEGGTKTLQYFIDRELYNECIIIQSPTKIDDGVVAPKIQSNVVSSYHVGTDLIRKYE